MQPNFETGFEKIRRVFREDETARGKPTPRSISFPIRYSRTSLLYELRTTKVAPATARIIAADADGA
jgi:hypothetical protein